jgi:hypothetical protein
MVFGGDVSQFGAQQAHQLKGSLSKLLGIQPQDVELEVTAGSIKVAVRLKRDVDPAALQRATQALRTRSFEPMPGFELKSVSEPIFAAADGTELPMPDLGGAGPIALMQVVYTPQFKEAMFRQQVAQALGIPTRDVNIMMAQKVGQTREGEVYEVTISVSFDPDLPNTLLKLHQRGKLPLMGGCVRAIWDAASSQVLKERRPDPNATRPWESTSGFTHVASGPICPDSWMIDGADIPKPVLARIRQTDPVEYQNVMNRADCVKPTTYHHFHEVSSQPSRRGWFSASRQGPEYELY